MKEINDNFDIEEQRWIPLIGEFIIHSASIEDSVYRFNEKYLKKTLVQQKNLKTNNFENQLNLFEVIYAEKFKDRNYDKDLLQNFLTSSKRLRKTRNTIAHNSLGLVFEETLDRQIKLIGFEIENKERVDVSINFEEFKDSLKDMKECRDNLDTLMILDIEEEANRMASLINKNE